MSCNIRIKLKIYFRKISYSNNYISPFFYKKFERDDLCAYRKFFLFGNILIIKIITPTKDWAYECFYLFIIFFIQDIIYTLT